MPTPKGQKREFISQATWASWEKDAHVHVIVAVTSQAAPNGVQVAPTAPATDSADASATDANDGADDGAAATTAQLQRHVVGFLTLTEKRVDQSMDTDVYLGALRVSPHYRRCGIGSRLILHSHRFALDTLRATGASIHQEGAANPVPLATPVH